MAGGRGNDRRPARGRRYGGALANQLPSLPLRTPPCWKAGRCHPEKDSLKAELRTGIAERKDGFPPARE